MLKEAAYHLLGVLILKAKSEELTISQQHVQQLINEKQALQMELQQANEQIETIQYEKQLLEQIQVTELQVIATAIVTTIKKGFS